MGPYAYKNSQWVSFDDIDTIEQKMQLIKDYDLGGAMIWALDLDDFNDQCGGGKYPLLTTINHNLGRLDNYARPELLETSQNWIRTSQEEEEEIHTTEIVIGDKVYLIDSDNNLYSHDTHEQVGTFDSEKNTMVAM